MLFSLTVFREHFLGFNPDILEPLHSHEKLRLRLVPLGQKTSGVGDHAVLFRAKRGLGEPRSLLAECLFSLSWRQMDQRGSINASEKFSVFIIRANDGAQLEHLLVFDAFSP